MRSKKGYQRALRKEYAQVFGRNFVMGPEGRVLIGSLAEALKCQSAGPSQCLDNISNFSGGILGSR